MFKIGEYVVCGNNGVCKIHEITTLNISGVDKKRKYYMLKPIYSETSTVYLPVDGEQMSMRRILSKMEADSLLDSIPQAQVLTIRDEKAAEMVYRECVQSNNCREWIRLWKTLYFRKKNRLEKGHKVTAVDSRYYKLAAEKLCGELALVLGMDKEEIAECIEGKFD
ncbi:MAG: CarD family transcriptional regulator [Lachnospiraceae bacterium]|nr:CarD family transcriptional regulator [Lachnospiraceae bacterium]